MTPSPSRPGLLAAARLLRCACISALCLPLFACSTLKSAQHWAFGGDNDSKPAAAATTPRLSNSPDGLDVYKGQYSWVRIQPSEAGGRSALPLRVDPDRLRTALSELKGTGGGFKNDPLFAKRELDEMVQPLADALAQAQPGQDVVFASTGKHTEIGLFETEAATAARVFVEGGRLNFIFGMTRYNFGDELRGEGMMRPFIVGSRGAARSQPTPVVGPDWQALAGRSDWMTIDAHLIEPQGSVQGTAVTPLTAPATPAPAPAPTPAAAGATPLAPAPAVAAPAARAPAAASDADSAATAERRLSTLQRLRDKGLISEQEFQERRKAVLDGL